MKRKKVFMSILVLFLLGFFSIGQVGNGVAASNAEPKTIKIGGAVSATGAFAGPATHVKEGYEFAVADINDSGGVFVKEFNKKIPLELIIYDDESNPTKTVSRLERLFSEDKVIVYLGGYTSVLAVPGCAIGEKNKVPWIGVAFSAELPHRQGYKYVFSPYPKTRDYVKSFEIYKHLPENQWPRKAAIFEREEDWGKEMADMFASSASKHGFKVAMRKKYSPGTKDFVPHIMEAKAAGADMVLDVSTTPEGMAMMKQMKELDYNPKWVYMVRAACSERWSEFVEGNFVCTVPAWHNTLPFPMVDKINARYSEKHGTQAAFEVGSAYSCVQIIADAIERAGNLDRKAIRDAMADTNMMTAMGPIKFLEDGSADFDYIVIVQHQNGKAECVNPRQYASAPFIYPFPKWSSRGGK
jgi:branched-chain amino acid transport system substrate-binding protein